MCLTDQQCKRGRPESKLRGKRHTWGVFSGMKCFRMLQMEMNYTSLKYILWPYIYLQYPECTNPLSKALGLGLCPDNVWMLHGGILM